VFSDVAHVYGVSTVAVFVLLRGGAAFFDFQAARVRLRDNMLIFIEREVGRFYASDAGGAILRLKDEISLFQSKHTESMTAALTQLTKTLHDNSNNLSETIKATTNGIHIEIANAIDEKLVRMTGDFAAAADTWEKSLAEAAKTQTSLNNSTNSIERAAAKLQASAELLGTHLQGHSSALSEQLIALVRAVESVKTAQDAIVSQSEYIEQNQKTLEQALHAYEASLQGAARSLGESLGAFVNLHAERSAHTINDALRGNIEKIMQLIRGAQ
jgi:chromosome segregation ATPase